MINSYNKKLLSSVKAGGQTETVCAGGEINKSISEDQ